MVAVLPDPAPATTSSGDMSAAMTSACSLVGSNAPRISASWLGVYFSALMGV